MGSVLETGFGVMDNLQHLFCARCGGVLTDLHKKTMIDGLLYHFYCGGKVFEEKLDKDIAKLNQLISNKRKKQ